MKRFLINIILFGCIILALSFLLDYVVSSGLRHVPKNHLETMNEIMTNGLNNDVLIFGNSRAACSYNPYIIDSVLCCNSRNIGVSGKSFLISELRYNIYREHNDAPKIAIVNIDPMELGLGAPGFERYQYFPYITSQYIQSILDYESFDWTEKYLPMFRYRGEYKYVVLGLCGYWGMNVVAPKQYKGYLNSNKPWNPTNMRNEKSKYPDGMPSVTNDSVVHSGERLIKHLLQDQVTPIMVYAPIYQELKCNYNQKSYLATMSIFEQWSKEYNIPILDYSSDVICNDSTLFQDGCHLNEEGANIFSKKLSIDIDSLISL